MSLPFVILIFYVFMYAQFGAYIYRLHKIFEGIEEIEKEIDPQQCENTQTKKSTAPRYMNDRYTYYLQCNLRPHR